MTLAFRPALWPTLFTVPAILVLLGLGTWQVQRMAWKNDIVARIDQRLSAAPVPLPARLDDVDGWEYRRVTVAGRFLHDREQYLLANEKRGVSGYHVVTPLERADGGGAVLVNRGWVPPERKNPATRAEGQVAGPVSLTGVVRKPWHQGWFVPDNDVGKNIWFYGDAAAMAQAMKVTAPLFFIEVDAAPNPGRLPQGGQTRVDIPNNHLQYAITWYAFSIVLLAIYFVWHRKQGRA